MREALSELLTMHEPAIYRIVVQGALDSNLSSRMAGMSITERHTSANNMETVLVGRLSDQAALTGVLNALYELHLPVLSAECLECG